MGDFMHFTKPIMKSLLVFATIIVASCAMYENRESIPPVEEIKEIDVPEVSFEQKSVQAGPTSSNTFLKTADDAEATFVEMSARDQRGKGKRDSSGHWHSPRVKCRGKGKGCIDLNRRRRTCAGRNWRKNCRQEYLRHSLGWKCRTYPHQHPHASCAKGANGWYKRHCCE